jgi:hypothetical protein
VCPAGELAGRAIALADLWGDRATEVHDRLVADQAEVRPDRDHDVLGPRSLPVADGIAPLPRRAVAALAADPKVMDSTCRVLLVGELAQRYPSPTSTAG